MNALSYGNSAMTAPTVMNYTETENLSSIDNLIHRKGRLFRTKMEVLAFEIVQRLCIKSTNLESLDAQQTGLIERLRSLDRQAQYHLRDHQEKRTFYEAMVKLEQERRSQHVECWRDVVMVMRDLLEVWESHENAKVRSQFINHA